MVAVPVSHGKLQEMCVLTVNDSDKSAERNPGRKLE